MAKHAALLLIAFLGVSSLIMTESALAQSIIKPSAPEFTLELVGPPYYIPTSYSLDSSTGQIVAKIGYTNPYSSLSINVKNQPFDSSYWNLYYNVRFKDHNSIDSWVEAYHASAPYPQQSTSSDYTDVGFSIEGQNMGIRVLAGAEIDIQVEAMIGSVHRAVMGNTAPWVFTGETSGWSETQTINIPANTPLSSSNTPSTSPYQGPQQTEQEVIVGAAITAIVIVAGLGFLIYLIKRK